MFRRGRSCYSARHEEESGYEYEGVAMAGRDPAISIGMPVYNGAAYLAAALDAVLAQTFQDWELILRDNASTDGTAAICQDYAARDPRIRYERAAVNEGAARNHNRTFALARAPYFKWWAADDLCAPTFLERCAATLDTHPDAAVAYPLAERIDAQGVVLHRLEQYLAHGRWPVSPAGQFRMLAEEFMYSGGATASLYFYGLIRAEALRRTRLNGPYIASDWILDLELTLLGRFIEIPEYLMQLREHPGSSSMGVNRLRYDRVQAVFDPRVRGQFRVFLSRARRYPEHVVVVARSALPLRQKVPLLAYASATVLRRVGRNIRHLWCHVGRAAAR
jgi:glycosyltransferase involved in cell wall biosynthesis